LVRYGGTEREVTIEEFRWLDRVDPQEFSVEGRRWEDFTADPTEGETSELVMIGHNRLWQPGMKTGDTDGRLLDLRTGRYRRIPFRGETSLPGCFLKGGRRVVVPGHDSVRGLLGLSEVDLKTGENRRLGGELLDIGFSLMPALSPDGGTVAVLHRGASEGLKQVSVCLVDLKMGGARPLG